MSDVPGLLSLYNLLARASNVSCSKGAYAFLSLPVTEDDRLSLAIDGFLPALQNPSLQIPQRILAAFVLHVLPVYTTHDHLNPFHDHLLRIFESERAIAIATLRIKFSLVGPSQRAPESERNGIQAENEQLVWVLWKILQGEGDDLAPYSPDILSRTALPEHLRPLHLDACGGSRRGNRTDPHPRRSSTEFPQPSLGFMDPTSHNSTTVFQTSNPLSTSGPPRTPSAPRLFSNRTPSTSELSPFDITFPESSGIYQNASKGEEGQMNGLQQQTVTKEPIKRHTRYQHSPDPPAVPYASISSPAFSDPIYSEVQADIGSLHQISHNQNSQIIGDQRHQTLLRRLYGQSSPEPLLSGIPRTYNLPNMNNQTGTSTKMPNEFSRVELQLQHPTPVLPRTAQSIQQKPTQNYLREQNITSENPSPLISVASDTRSNTRPRLDPISRPYPNALSSQRTVLDSPGFEIFSVDGRGSRPDITTYGHDLPQGSLMGVNNNIVQQKPGIPFAQQKRTSTPTRVSPTTRSPGVIGSGRPSASKTDPPVGHNTIPSRWSQIGIIGNGRPGSSVSVGGGPLANRGTDSRGEHENMIPFSVLRMRSMKEQSEKRVHGFVSHPETDLGGDNGRKGAGKTDGQLGLLEKLTALNIGRRAQEPSQETEITSYKLATQAFDRNWPPSQDKAESVPTHAPLETLQRQAAPLQPTATTFHPQHVSPPLSAADQNITKEAVTVSPRQPSSALPSVATFDHGQLCQVSENPPPSLLHNSRREETAVDEKERNELSHAIFLLLSARERVLTLAEQRMLQPHLSTLSQPLSLLRPSDIPPLVAKNTDVAAKLLLFLLDRKDEDALRIERIVKEASNDGLCHMYNGSSDDALPLPTVASIDSMAAVDAIQAMVRFINTCGAPSNSIGSNEVSPFGGREAKEGYLDAIRKLPPTMQSFNLIAKLLRPTNHGGATSEQQDDTPEARVETLIRTEVLGGFMSGCVRWIEHAEQEEKEGEVHDDRVAIAIASLCRFYSSLLKHGFVSAASETDTTEIKGFALQFSRFEEARSLYSTLAAAR